jgi:hypothetical protein
LCLKCKISFFIYLTNYVDLTMTRNILVLTMGAQLELNAASLPLESLGEGWSGYALATATALATGAKVATAVQGLVARAKPTSNLLTHSNLLQSIALIPPAICSSCSSDNNTAFILHLLANDLFLSLNHGCIKKNDTPSYKPSSFLNM